MSNTLWDNLIRTLTALVILATLLSGALVASAAVDGTAQITSPRANTQISGSVTVTGTAAATNFQFYKLEFGPGSSPSQWAVIGDLHRQPVTNGPLGTWDVNVLPPGDYTLKLTVVDHTGNWVESSVPVVVGAASVPPRQPPTRIPTAVTTRQPTAGADGCARTTGPITNLTLVPLAVRPASAPSGQPGDRGTIHGRVSDASGRGLCGLTVRIARGGFETRATTGADGGYEAAGLEPGEYSVVVEQQISTPVTGLNLAGGQAIQVDFAQIRPTTPTAGPTGTRGPSPTAGATRPATATPPLPEPTATPTPVTRINPAGPLDFWRWWGWLGFEFDLEGLASHLYLGIMGGFALFAMGVVIALIRR